MLKSPIKYITKLVLRP